MPFDLAFTCVDAGAITASNFTVNVYPTNPLPGQTIHVQIDGTGGHDTSNPVQELGAREIWVETDFGESGATFIGDGDYPLGYSGRTRNAEVGYGARTGHAYDAPGTYTLTITSWTFGSGLKTQTVSVTVADPDAHSWDKEIYIDLTGDATGFPATSATVEHVLNYTQFAALDRNDSGSDVRYHVRRGVTHNLPIAANGDIIRVENALAYWVPFGTGADPVFEDTAASYYGATVFRIIGTDNVFIIRDMTLKSSYDPVNAYFSNARLTWANVVSANTGVEISMYNCTGEGLDIMMRASGVASGSGYAIGLVSCFAKNCQDFSLGYIAGSTYCTVRGCTARSPVNKARGDDKGDTASDMTDHSHVRIEGYKHVAFQGNVFDFGGGWSAFGADRYIQGMLRLHGFDNASTGYASIAFNTAAGGNMVGIGEHSPTASTAHEAANYTMVACNDFTFAGGQADFAIKTTGAGGVMAFANVIYQPAIECARNVEDVYLFIIDDRGLTSSAIWEVPNYIEFNTFVRDLHEGLNSQGSDGTIIEVTADADAVVTARHNLLVTDSHDSSVTVTASSAVSRGDYFRPITGGAADSTTSDTPPPIDFTGRRNITGVSSVLKGAHATSATATAATAPSWGGGITIGLLSSYGGTEFLGLTDISNLTAPENGGPVQIEYQWAADGVVEGTGELRGLLPTQKVNAGSITNWDGSTTGYTSGTELTLTVYASNRSGTRVASSVSNTFTVP